MNWWFYLAASDWWIWVSCLPKILGVVCTVWTGAVNSYGDTFTQKGGKIAMSVWSSLAPVVIRRCFYPFEIQCTYRTRMVLVMVQKQVVSFANGSWVKICKKKKRRTGDFQKKLLENIGKTTWFRKSHPFFPDIHWRIVAKELEVVNVQLQVFNFCLKSKFQLLKLREFFRSSAVNWPVDPINKKQPKAVFPMLKTGRFSC